MISWQPLVLREVLQAIATVRGAHEALVTDRMRFSWADIHTKSIQMAQAMHALGIHKNYRFGISNDNSQ